MLVDSHSHLFLEEFADDLPQVMQRAREAGVTHIFMPNIDSTTIESLLSVCAAYKEFCFPMIGLHPTSVNKNYKKELDIVAGQLASSNGYVAIGEIGLDYHWDEPEPELQKAWFVRQLGLAREKKLPVIIHSRDAAKDTLDIMKAEKAGEIGGVIHCFSYSLEMAKEYLNMGFYLGIGGVLTFNNAKKLKEVVAYMPLDRIVLETDCPYLSPVPNRGKRNSSLNLPYVVEEISRIKNVSVEQIIEITNRNAKQMYRLSL